MVEIRNISKKYVTGDLVQLALDDISLSLRENEFVAILGPSGSGKTTLLNVIGGLDRYDSGDLIINNISTKDYSDKDWDSYRNHTIGFVFQSYNLIPHQDILSNVELALTISGISKNERKQRALDALDKVGLKEQAHKKPNQLSGGQMQRVAIARALVNNPDILLADEPTGALDSKTSVQIMDLLKEVAKDKLVVMVTHNPELANQYANRIVKLQDGKIIDDSNPYIYKNDSDIHHENMGKSSMSFLTSLALSFNNLKTKKGRTFLTAFAGSIGIIGIALILSLSNGVDTYIKSIEENTLSEYPLTILNTGFDMSAMLQRPSTNDNSENQTSEVEVGEIPTISSIVSTTNLNDLKSLKKYLDNNKEINEYAKAIEYNYNINPQIYSLNGDEYRLVHPDQTVNQVTGASNIPSMMSTSFNSFLSLPEDEDLYIDQYEVLEGRWPKDAKEAVVVLTSSSKATDLVLYATGLKDPKELEQIIQEYTATENSTIISEVGSYKYKDFIGINYKVVNVGDLYEYDETHRVYINKADNKDYMLNLIKKGDDLTIVGVVKPKKDSDAVMLSSGIYYHDSLDKIIIEKARASEIVKKQLANKEIDVFTGKRFDDEEKNTNESIFSFDEEAFNNAFSFNPSALNINPSSFNIDTSNIVINPEDFNFDQSDIDLNQLLKNVNIKVNQDELYKMMGDLIDAYQNEAIKDASTDYTKLGASFEKYLQTGRANDILRNELNGVTIDTEAISNFTNKLLVGFVNYLRNQEINDDIDISAYVEAYLSSNEVINLVEEFRTNNKTNIDEELLQRVLNTIANDYKAYADTNNLVNPDKMVALFNDFIVSDKATSIITNNINKVVNADEIQKQIETNIGDTMQGYSNNIADVMNKVMEQLGNSISTQMANAMSQVSNNLQNAFNIDTNALQAMFNMNMSDEELGELMMSMMNNSRASYKNNLKKLNYADQQEPYSIYIFPKDFNSKEKITEILDDYNQQMKNSNQQEKVINYTDYVATLMSSVTNIVDTISYILVAFVAISLIVSSIMIGIITYISVLERTKEIGILRAIGASKRNISQVFNAETFIIGLLAGILGIIASILIIIPGNMIIHKVTGNYNVNAILPTTGAIILIIISVILTLMGGLIPSKAAAKKDPVTALRTE